MATRRKGKVFNIKYQTGCSIKRASKREKDFGFDKFAIVQALFYNRRMQLSRFDKEPTNIVKELTGHEPEDFEPITKQYFDSSPFKKRTLSSWLHTFIKFNRLPFVSLPDKSQIAKINQ